MCALSGWKGFREWQVSGRLVGGEGSAKEGLTETNSQWRRQHAGQTQRGKAVSGESADVGSALGLWGGTGSAARAVSSGRGPRRPAKVSHYHRSNGSFPFVSKKTV